MNTYGRHVIMEYRGCDSAVLNDIVRIEALLLLAVQKSKATPIQSMLHPFQPQGVSGVILLQESHISIHTWPELGYAALDFYTCGICDPEAGHDVLRHGLGATSAELMVLDRGLRPEASIVLAKHFQEHSATDAALETIRTTAPGCFVSAVGGA